MFLKRSTGLFSISRSYGNQVIDTLFCCIYSVNLFEYEDTAVTIRVVYWTVFIALIIAGIVKILFTHFKFIKGQRVVTSFSIGISILAVLFFAMTREAYAITVVFLLLLVKSALLYKQIKVGIR